MWVFLGAWVAIPLGRKHQELKQIAEMALMGSQEGVSVPKLSQELGDQGFASMVKRVSSRIGIIEVSVHKELL